MYSEEKIELAKKLSQYGILLALSQHTAAVTTAGKVLYTGNSRELAREVSTWSDIVSLCGCDNFILGLKADGTVVSAGENEFGACDVEDWFGIVAISSYYDFSVGLRADGTVVTTKHIPASEYSTENGRSVASEWQGVKAVQSGTTRVFALLENGAVISTDPVEHEYPDLSSASKWRNIVSLCATEEHVVGLKPDGTVLAIGNDASGQCDISDWSDIIAISTACNHTVGLRSDGTVIAKGWGEHGECSVNSWMDIVAISAGQFHTIGLKSNGRVVSTPNLGDDEFDFGQRNVSDWNLGDPYVLLDNLEIARERLLENFEEQRQAYEEKMRILEAERLAKEAEEAQRRAEAEEEEEIRRAEEEHQRIIMETRKLQKVCRHCGGKFKGFFTKTCSVCGRKKDY